MERRKKKKKNRKSTQRRGETKKTKGWKKELKKRESRGIKGRLRRRSEQKGEVELEGSARGFDRRGRNNKRSITTRPEPHLYTRTTKSLSKPHATDRINEKR